MDVASRFDAIKIAELKLPDFENYDVITTVHALYSNEENYFSALQKITQMIWQHRLSWTEPWFVLVRESSNWIYARTKVMKDDKMAKSEFIKDYREARHHGIAIGLDTLRWTNIDKEIRDLAQYKFFKALGDMGLPDNQRFLYRYWRPDVMMRLKPNVFGLSTYKGAVGFGKFDYPLWHKEEKENILWTTKIEVKRSNQPLPDERRYGIGDFEHSEIILKYMELNSMIKVMKTLGRSLSTIHAHIKRHNSAVERKGECPKCKHSDCEFSKDTIIKRK